MKRKKKQRYTKPNLPKIYIASGGSVFAYYKYKNVLIPCSTKFEHCDFRDLPTFGTRFDALFHNVLQALRAGKSFKNYKSSKYYNQYRARLESEHPELLL